MGLFNWIKKRGEGSKDFKVGESSYMSLNSKEEAIREFHTMKLDWAPYFAVINIMMEALELFGHNGAVKGYMGNLFQDLKDGEQTINELRKVKKSLHNFRSLFLAMMDLDVYEVDGVKIEDYHRATDVLWNTYRGAITTWENNN